MAKKAASKAPKGKAKKKPASSATAGRRSAAQPAPPRKASAGRSSKKGGTNRQNASKATLKLATAPAAATKRRRAPRPPTITAPVRADSSAVECQIPLNRQETEQFRRMLLDKRAEILDDVSTLRNEALNKDRRDAAGDLSSMPIHMADLGSDNYELEFTLGLIEGERAILKEIDEALERIQNNTYGICLATGKPIGKARLKAKPWAKYCYEYTLAQEQGQTRRL